MSRCWWIDLICLTNIALCLFDKYFIKSIDQFDYNLCAWIMSWYYFLAFFFSLSHLSQQESNQTSSKTQDFDPLPSSHVPFTLGRNFFSSVAQLIGIYQFRSKTLAHVEMRGPSGVYGTIHLRQWVSLVLIFRSSWAYPSF